MMSVVVCFAVRHVTRWQRVGSKGQKRAYCKLCAVPAVWALAQTNVCGRAWHVNNEKLSTWPGPEQPRRVWRAMGLSQLGSGALRSKRKRRPGFRSSPRCHEPTPSRLVVVTCSLSQGPSAALPRLPGRALLLRPLLQCLPPRKRSIGYTGLPDCRHSLVSFDARCRAHKHGRLRVGPLMVAYCRPRLTVSAGLSPTAPPRGSITGPAA